MRVLLLALVFLLCAGAARPAQESGPFGRVSGHRLLEQGPTQLNGSRAFSRAATAAAAPQVTVYAGRPSGGPALEPKRFGGYRSEETEFWDKIYDPTHTLGPLRMPSNRVQISLWEAELGPDGAFLDPQGTQLGIIQSVAKAVTDDIFITVGYPWTKKSRELIAAGFPDGWQDYWSRTFTTLADKLASPPYWTGKPVWIECFGEPDLFWWESHYGKDPQKVYQAAKLAHDAFARYRDKFRIGGLGFAFLWTDPNDFWIRSFFDFYRREGMRYDFISFHSYLTWTDASDPAEYPPGETYPNIHWRTQRLRQLLQEKGVGDIPLVISEYSWPDPDGYGAAGFGDAAKSARTTMTRHHSCARTLQAIDIVLAEPAIARAYWAQGVGRFHTPTDQDVYRVGGVNALRMSGLGAGPGAGTGGLLSAQNASSGGQLSVATASRAKYVHSYFPAVIYDQFTGGVWHYKASYYALWFYGQMRGTRVAASVADPALGVWASKLGRETIYVAIWNKSARAARFARLAIPFARPGWPCTMYRVDDTTFKVSAGGEDAVVSGPTTPTPPVDASIKTVKHALRWTRLRRLRKEASILLVITIPS